ncbi:Protein argonaute 1B [Platanthera zijinensis]|uniref:Protein argonaute 1B n=1 Tax=Platanthera zijinensis TaxID=2320716 RepID=A0AAP0BAJ2_9ASPA
MLRRGGLRPTPQARLCACFDNIGCRLLDAMNFTTVEAHILLPPQLKYHETGREKDCLPRVGHWNMINKKVVNGGRVNNWSCINLCHELAKMWWTSGMEFAQDPLIPPIFARLEQVERALKAHYQDAMSILCKQHKELDLLIVILPDNNGFLYGGCVSRLAEDNQNWLKITLCIGVAPLPLQKILRLVERAVRHSGEITKYAGLVCAHAHRQELIQDLFKVDSDPKHENSPGGMITILPGAPKPLLPGCRSPNTICLLSAAQQPHNHCFFSVGGSSSPFIGTSKPAHYHMLYDENKLTADGRQTLTNNICYIYTRCTQSIFVDIFSFLVELPPTYYPHLAAFRARFYMEPETQDNGSVASVTAERAAAADGAHDAHATHKLKREVPGPCSRPFSNRPDRLPPLSADCSAASPFLPTSIRGFIFSPACLQPAYGLTASSPSLSRGSTPLPLSLFYSLFLP